MAKRTQLGEVMETACAHCGSRFRLTEVQLKQAYGKVRCGKCGEVFNALQALKNYEGELPPGYLEKLHAANPDSAAGTETEPALSLYEAMYGGERRASFSIGPLGWFIGILLLLAVATAQALYYQRYQLIEDPRFQQQIINLCRLLPCAESQFASVEQIRMLERNVFTHPVANNALMVTGSFSNQAPFAQRLPDLLISLFDVRGKLIANRRFTPKEYLLEDRNRRSFGADAVVQFRLELVDPGTDALTYEFEFY